MKLQMDEADWILVNKSDTLSGAKRTEIEKLLKENFPNKPTGLISAKTGDGVAAWLKKIQAAPPPQAGATIVPVDYDRYAHGEAVLGWLNAAVKVSRKNSNENVSMLLQKLMDRFHVELKKAGAEIGHVKAILHLDDKECAANLTRLDGNVDVREVEPKTDVPTLILNARVQMSPEELEKMVRELLETVASEHLDVQIQSLRCLMPGRPNPTHRFTEIV
jgi:G3E family GTPase